MIPELALVCLAQAVYYEARDQMVQGRLAVAQVVMNRVASPSWPDNVCDVVHEGGTRRHKCQFSFWCDGLPERPDDEKAWIDSVLVASAAIAGTRDALIGKADHYHADYASPGWRRTMELIAQVGGHLFYRRI